MSKILIAYFSASGTTKRLAENLAKASGGDLFEIEPKERYTDEDLNWMNSRSRSSVEMADRNSRPEIKNKTDITKYDYVFVGFPIWWYREPSIIDTFLKYALPNGKDPVRSIQQQLSREDSHHKSSADEQKSEDDYSVNMEV